MAKIPPHTQLSTLKTARENLSKRYATSRACGFKNTFEREAYIHARMPATQAAVLHALHALNAAYAAPIKSCLDLGCGPGTGTIALNTWLSDAQNDPPHFTLMDQDQAMLDHAAWQCKNAQIHTAAFIHADLISASYPHADIVLLSYVLGEMSSHDQINVLKKAFDATQQFLILVHPGTQTLFHDFVQWRDQLIQWGGTIIAPCPAQTQCPLTQPPVHTHPTSWCHFKIRIARTKTLKYLKSAQLGFEDEPFNYLIVSKHPPTQPPAKIDRIITAPRKHTGHIGIDVCTGTSIESRTFSKKHPHYKILKKKSWGDVIEET